MNRRILTKVNYLLTCINVRVGCCILNINNNINKDYEVTVLCQIMGENQK